MPIDLTEQTKFLSSLRLPTRATVRVLSQEAPVQKQLFLMAAEKLGLRIVVLTRTRDDGKTDLILHVSSKRPRLAEQIAKEAQRMIDQRGPREIVVDTITGTWFDTESVVRLEGDHVSLFLEVMDKGGTSLACQLARALGDEI